MASLLQLVNAALGVLTDESAASMFGYAGLPSNQRLKAAGLTALSRKRAEMKQKTEDLQVSHRHMHIVESLMKVLADSNKSL